VFGWRYNPRIIFKGGKGTKLIDMDGNEYYDMSSGMMCMVLGHSHPELTEVNQGDGRHVHPPVPPGTPTHGPWSSPSA
jgi:adenosylmethionine-8-amino-7-oxononanoate aminotransferase